MNKFTKKLSQDNQSTLTDRAEIAASDCMAEMTAFLQQLDSRKREINRKLVNHSDIGPDKTTTLKVVDDTFCAKEWIKTMHGLRMQKELIDVEIKVAEDINNDWFVNEEA